MNTEEYRNLVHEQAHKSGVDPDIALREFIEVVRQMTLARTDSERIYEQLQDGVTPLLLTPQLQTATAA